MTPIYDVMSARPNYAHGLIRRIPMKLAMAVGESRHCMVSEILPRHFAQSAKAAGISQQQTQQLLHGLEKDVPSALDRTAMPDDVSAGFAETIRENVARKLSEIRAFLDQ